MSLEEELKLSKPLNNTNHEALLSLVRTHSMLMRHSDRFFTQYGVTDVQFNILMTLRDDGKRRINQQELSRKLVVTKTNVVGLLDRLERNGYIARESHKKDRRVNLVSLTPKGTKLIASVEGKYFREVDQVFQALSISEKKAIISGTEKIREYLRTYEESAVHG